MKLLTVETFYVIIGIIFAAVAWRVGVDQRFEVVGLLSIHRAFDGCFILFVRSAPFGGAKGRGGVSPENSSWELRSEN